MAQKLMTPGVYIEEVNAFPGSVVEVETAIPAFIGYTQKASRNGKSLKGQPTRITSLKEYIELFGKGNNPHFDLSEVGESDGQMTIGEKGLAISHKANNNLLFYNSIRFFYANGGSTCYIVSVGTYGKKSAIEIKKKELLDGLGTLVKEQEPTMLVIPDAVNLEIDICYSIYTEMLKQCSDMQSRVALLDIHDGFKNKKDEDIIKNFRGKIGTEYLNYAAAYYPWLDTSIVQKDEITFKNFIDADLASMLPEKKARKLVNGFPTTKDGMVMDLLLQKDKHQALTEALAKDIERAKTTDNPGTAPKAPPPLANAATASEEKKKEQARKMEDHKNRKAVYDAALLKYTADQVIAGLSVPEHAEKPEELAGPAKKAYKDKSDALKAALNHVDQAKGLTNAATLISEFTDNKNSNYHLGLIATSVTYSHILDKVREIANLLPPASAMAGIYTSVDNNRGVWKSPANISVSAVIKPSVNITHKEQENLNVDALSGKSINAIRTFPGIGTLVWGGRTLDGNSLDWRYINVRRTMIMLEQSIKLALRAYVFEPNDANTWVTVKSMIVNFLTEKWKQGALAGASPEDAFDVQIGLGSTMTAVDILEGKMLVSVKLAIVRPAEFIVVTFQQQMQKS